ncbi:hypothetical protein Tco_1077647 [Tanacetum coccineum]
MDTTRAQQQALDDELVAPADRLKIGKSNLRLSSTLKSKEPTLQVVLDALKLTPFYNAFEISADVPEIYMQEFWVTVSRHHSSLRFKLNGKSHTVNVDNFRDMLKICPKLPGQKFEEPPLEEDILSFIRDLGHTGEIKFLSDVNVNHMHQPWRSFAAIINKCLSGKTTALESLRLSRAQILWGMYHNKKVDYVYLLWEDLMFQVENKNSKKNNDMYYPRFTKVIIDYFMAKDQAIPRRNKMFWHHARDDFMFTTVRVISKHQDTQVYGAILPQHLTNQAMLESKAYMTYRAYATGKRIKSSAKGDKAAKKKQPAETSIDKGLTVLSDVALTEAEQLKLVIERSKTQTHSSHSSGSGAYEGTEDDEDEVNVSEKDDENDNNDDDDDADNQDDENQDDDDDEQTDSDNDAVSSIPGIVDAYLANKMNDAVKTAVQLQSDKLKDEAQAENKDFLNKLDDNIKKIEEQVKEQVKAQVSKILPKIEKTVNEQLEAEVMTRSSTESKTSLAIAANLSELELKKILIEKMESNKSINRSNEQKNLYKALVEAYESDKLILDTYRDAVSFKRCRDDEDKDKEPSAGSNRGSKRRRARKEPESTSALKEKTSKTTGKSNEGPPTPDRDWNKTLPADHGPIQPWLSNLARQENPRELFDELTDTPFDFSAFVMNRLKVETLTPELLAGPTFELMKGTCKSLIIAISNGLKSWSLMQYEVKQQSTMTNMPSGESHIGDANIVEWHGYKHLDWITVRRDDDKLHTFKEGDFKRLLLQDIEDILLLLVQDKLTNLNVEERVERYQKKLNITKPDSYRSGLKRREAYSAYSNPRGFIYQNRDKKNKLMRVDELHKFSDGTLNDVRTALDDRLKGIRMEYLTKTIWRQSDRERAKVMI